MKKDKQWWQKSLSYDIKFLEQFKKGDVIKNTPKIIDTFKIQKDLKL